MRFIAGDKFRVDKYDYIVYDVNHNITGNVIIAYNFTNNKFKKVTERKLRDLFNEGRLKWGHSEDLRDRL